MAAQPWTLNRLIDKVRDDLDLHAEDFVTTDDLKQFVEDAITDAEEITVQCFADTLLTFADLEVTSGDPIVDLPDDIYEARIRGLFYSEQGFSAAENLTFLPYKLRQMKLEDMGYSSTNDIYRYRLVNSTTDGQKLYIYPSPRETSDDRFRLWYIRQFKRPTNLTDVLDSGLRPQYILSHVKCAVMQKDGNALLEVESANLLKQEEMIKRSLSRQTDDDEGFLLEPNDYSLGEAYGDEY